MIEREDIWKIVENYSLRDLTIATIGSHSALDICEGAKFFGFKTLVICQEGREKVYSKYFKSENEKGVIDEVITLKKFSDITDEKVIKELQERNTIFIPHRSFEVYVGFDKIENKFTIPIFGNRELLRAEERNYEKGQYYLMEKAKIPFPKRYKNPKDIDTLAIVKVSEAQRQYERAFFLASNFQEYKEKSKKLIEEGKITEKALKEAIIEEFVIGAHVNFNYFYSTIYKKLELLGIDIRRQTNLDGLLKLPVEQQIKALEYLDVKTIEVGHIACTVRESLLEKIFDLGEKFVNVIKEELSAGIIGPFALQSVITPGPPEEKIIVFDISLRIPGSPGTKYTPYSLYLHREEMSFGRRIAMEIKKAVKLKRVKEIVT